MSELDELIALCAERAGLDAAALEPAIARRCLEALPGGPGSDLGELCARARADEAVLDEVAEALTARRARWFEVAPLYESLREHALPRLRTHPSIQIWHPACATGEEAFSTAILLHEAGLLERARIYATDVSQAALAVAAAGRYPAEALGDAAEAYRAAGGRAALEEYYQLERGPSGLVEAVMRPLLRQRVSFLEHSLVFDGSPNEFQLIVDLAALRLFSPATRARALGLFHDSLCRSGLMALGDGESLAQSPSLDAYVAVEGAPRLWRRVR